MSLDFNEQFPDIKVTDIKVSNELYQMFKGCDSKATEIVFNEILKLLNYQTYLCESKEEQRHGDIWYYSNNKDAYLFFEVKSGGKLVNGQMTVYLDVMYLDVTLKRLYRQKSNNSHLGFLFTNSANAFAFAFKDLDCFVCFDNVEAQNDGLMWILREYYYNGKLCIDGGVPLLGQELINAITLIHRKKRKNTFIDYCLIEDFIPYKDINDLQPNCIYETLDDKAIFKYTLTMRLDVEKYLQCGYGKYATVVHIKPID